MDWRSLLPPAPTAGGTSAAIPATPGLRLAGRRAILLPAALLAATLVALQAVPVAADEGWTIDAFDVDISIHQDAIMAVRETLQVDFGTQSHHGIFRDIPVVYEWDRDSHRVYDLTVDAVTDGAGRNWPYVVSENGADKEIKIGDPNKTLSGRQTYVIAYTVAGALNGFADHDELYWNVTGQQWAVPITEAGALLLFLLGAAWVARMVWRRGRDMEYATAYYLTKDPTERVRPLFRPEAVVPEYQPPDNLRPAQLGLILDESADTKDVTATIVDLAVRGYLTIKEVKNGKHDWELVQIKDQTGLLPYEAAIFNGLFDGKVKQARLSALKVTFRFPLGQAETLLYEDSVRLRWFTGNPQTTRVLWVFLGIFVVLIGFGVALGLGALAGWGLLGVAIILVGSLIIATNSWMPRRTALGTDLFRKTLGFRVYMNAAEKDRQAFAEKGGIFTQYLPCAIVLRCVHRWAKAFEGIDTSAVVSSWYQGQGAFTAVVFASSLQGFSSNLSTAVSETPGGSGGSGGGGGGFSGGGGGGGGGGAW